MSGYWHWWMPWQVTAEPPLPPAVIIKHTAPLARSPARHQRHSEVFRPIVVVDWKKRNARPGCRPIGRYSVPVCRRAARMHAVSNASRRTETSLCLWHRTTRSRQRIPAEDDPSRRIRSELEVAPTTSAQKTPSTENHKNVTSKQSAFERMQIYIGWTDVTESMVTIRSPFCGYNLA